MSAEIKAVTAALSSEIRAVAAENRARGDDPSGRIDNLRLWAIGLVAAVIVGFARCDNDLNSTLEAIRHGFNGRGARASAPR